MRLPRLPNLFRDTRLVLALIAFSGALRCGAGDGPAGREWWRRVAAAEAPLESEIRKFDSTTADPAAAVRAARDVESSARRAREAVESLSPPPGMETSHREELVFLNHVIPGFERFAHSDGGTRALEELRSILRRGRAHQGRARRQAG
jgi:hypothetical protein